MTVRVIQGDALEVLATLPNESVHCCVTSPPYWGLRDYNVGGQLGLESTPEEYVERLVGVMREVWRVLRCDGTLWLNLGDSYAGSGRGPQGRSGKMANRAVVKMRPGNPDKNRGVSNRDGLGHVPGLKPKDLVGIPWRVAFALQTDGWWLRSDVVWAKPNPMPESVSDRPTKAHEYVFLFAKAKHYYFDQEAVREPHEMTPQRRPNGHAGRRPEASLPEHKWSGLARAEPGVDGHPAGRNIRSVWTVATAPFKEAHFAVFPPKLIEPCIKAGTSEKGCCLVCGASLVRVVERDFVPQDDVSPEKLAKSSNKGLDPSSGWGDVPRGVVVTKTTGWQPSCKCGADTKPSPWDCCVDTKPCVVLDCFGGAGTSGLVADRLGRDAILIELNPEYAEMARERIRGDAPLFAEVT